VFGEKRGYTAKFLNERGLDPFQKSLFHIAVFHAIDHKNLKDLAVFLNYAAKNMINIILD